MAETIIGLIVVLALGLFVTFMLARSHDKKNNKR